MPAGKLFGDALLLSNGTPPSVGQYMFRLSSLQGNSHSCAGRARLPLSAFFPRISTGPQFHFIPYGIEENRQKHCRRRSSEFYFARTHTFSIHLSERYLLSSLLRSAILHDPTVRDECAHQAQQRCADAACEDHLESVVAVVVQPAADHGGIEGIGAEAQD